MTHIMVFHLFVSRYDVIQYIRWAMCTLAESIPGISRHAGKPAIKPAHIAYLT